jgi:hypothetical protein
VPGGMYLHLMTKGRQIATKVSGNVTASPTQRRKFII